MSECYNCGQQDACRATARSRGVEADVAEEEAGAATAVEAGATAAEVAAATAAEVAATTAEEAAVEEVRSFLRYRQSGLAPVITSPLAFRGDGRVQQSRTPTSRETSSVR